MTYKYTKEQIKDTVEGLGYKYFTGDNYDVNILLVLETLKPKVRLRIGLMT